MSLPDILKMKWHELPPDMDQQYIAAVKAHHFPRVTADEWKTITNYYSTLDWKLPNSNIPFIKALRAFGYAEPKSLFDLESRLNKRLFSIYTSSNDYVVNIRREFIPFVRGSLNLIRTARDIYPQLVHIRLGNSSSNPIHEDVIDKLLSDFSQKESGSNSFWVHSPEALVITDLLTVANNNGKLDYYINTGVVRPDQSKDDWYKEFLTSFYEHQLAPRPQPPLPIVPPSPQEPPAPLPPASSGLGSINQYFQIVDLSPEIKNPFAFVIMPFSDEVVEQSLFADVIRPILKRAYNLNCYRSDDDKRSIKVDNKIYTMIRRSKVVIADITGNNPNVFYELGISHALNKNVIIISKKAESDYPFDVSIIHIESYENADDLANKLHLQLAAHGFKRNVFSPPLRYEKYVKHSGDIFGIRNGKAEHIGDAGILYSHGLTGGTKDPQIINITFEELKEYLA